MSVKKTCAPGNQIESWYKIDWKKAYRMIRKLQKRIAKATKADKKNKVKSLQWILTHSYSGKVMAIRRVTENSGKATPGVDGVIWNSGELKLRAIKELGRRGYSSKALRRIYIPKKNNNSKKRPLSIPTMKDRAMQALYLLALEPVSETIGANSSYGFRKERSTADAIGKVFRILSRKNSPEWVLEGDIRGCFDNISHEWLLKNIPIDKEILRKWLKAGYLENGKWCMSEIGTPQGGIISPTLANMTLDGLEKELKKRFPQGKCKKVNIVRYADDFIITSSKRETLMEEIKPLIEEFLKERGLELSDEKTKVTHIETGFNFLGEHIRKYKGKLIIKPSKENFKAIAKKIREIIENHKSVTQGCLIRLLNPLIRGWCNYHSGVCSKRDYNKLDNLIWEKLWQWCCRRHPNKSKRWTKFRYFKGEGSRNWIFKTDTGETLLKAADTKIVRHILIRSDYNPFDPEWEVYSEKRIQALMARNIRHRNRILRIWKTQEGRCPLCEEWITKETGWNLHHITKRVDGGTEKLVNLMLLHPLCHKQFHYKKNVAGSI